MFDWCCSFDLAEAAGFGVEGVAFAEGEAEVAGEFVEGADIDVFGETIRGFDEFVAAEAHFEDGDDFAFSAVEDVGVVGFVAGGSGLLVLGGGEGVGEGGDLGGAEFDAFRVHDAAVHAAIDEEGAFFFGGVIVAVGADFGEGFAGPFDFSADGW